MTDSQETGKTPQLWVTDPCEHGEYEAHVLSFAAGSPELCSGGHHRASISEIIEAARKLEGAEVVTLDEAAVSQELVELTFYMDRKRGGDLFRSGTPILVIPVADARRIEERT